MPKKILVVDDERQIAKLVEVNLRKAGYDVVCAYDGEEALAKVESEKPNMIVLDVMMPKKNGWDVLKELRLPDVPFIPVIMLTAKAQDVDIFIGWQTGCDMYLTKPFDPKMLLSYADRIFQAQEAGIDLEGEPDKIWEV